MTPPPTLRWRALGQHSYTPVWQAMRAFTDCRDGTAPDEFWTLEHAPVYTLGQAGRPEHLHDPAGVPVLRSDRGGQVTYHGPGQLVGYLLYDLRRGGLGIRTLVQRLEGALLDLLADLGVTAELRPGAPGVYVAGAKLAALGLRVRRGCSYHGISLNADLELAPFRRIDPCGYPGLAVTRLADLGVTARAADLAAPLARHCAARLGLTLEPAPARLPETAGPLPTCCLSSGQ